MLAQRIDIDALCARAEALCRRIAPPDLGDLPFYIVLQSRVPAIPWPQEHSRRIHDAEP